MALAKRNYCYVDFPSELPVPLFAKTTNAIATGAGTQEDYFRIGGDKYFELYQDGANLEIDAGPMFSSAAAGWTIPVDAAADAVEITRGIVATTAQQVFTVGTSPAFFLRVVAKVTSIARNVLFTVGFRKLGAYVTIAAGDAATALAAHTDKAMIGTVAAAGTFATQTSNDNSDLQTSLAHAVMADTEHVALEVNVSAAGAVTYRLGTGASAALAKAALAADASAVAFSFDDAEVLIPCIQVIGAAAGVGDTALVSYECGYQV